jgi:DNA repair photolyase
MRVVNNPRHRFERQYVEWLDEPPPARLEVHEETATKEILSKNDSPDIPFTWSLNPYRGCTHACAYCYARPTHEYLGFGAGTDFETRIVVKLQAPELLRARLGSRAWRGDVIAFSGDTDCYQPLEAHYHLTRRCLEACRDLRNPVMIVTKAWLVQRDAALIGEIARVAGATACVSLAFDDPALARAIEPGAPRPARRIEAIRALADAGVRTGVIFGPIIPGLNEDQIPTVLEKAKAAGAQFASRLLLRLPHAVKDVFLERVRRELPDRAKRIESRIRDVRGGGLSDSRFHDRMRGQGAYWDLVDATFRLHAARLGLAARDDRHVAEPALPRDPPHRPGDQLQLFG